MTNLKHYENTTGHHDPVPHLRALFTEMLLLNMMGTINTDALPLLR